MSDEDDFMPTPTSSGKRKSGTQPGKSKRQQRQVPTTSAVERKGGTNNQRLPPPLILGVAFKACAESKQCTVCRPLN